jgi:hypothetical protein
MAPGATGAILEIDYAGGHSVPSPSRWVREAERVRRQTQGEDIGAYQEWNG